MSYTAPLSFDLSPVRLAYVAALRGVLPRKPGQPFSYVQTGTFDPETLLCLAASNPEGRFYGLLADDREAATAGIIASERGVWNISFSSSDSILPANLNYLCCDTGLHRPTDAEREALFDMAAQRLTPGGTLVYRYQAYESTDEQLRFLITSFKPSLSPAQALEFLDELEALGSLYFNTHSEAKAALAAAKSAKDPDSFFAFCLAQGTSVESGTYETLAGLLPRGFAAAGDATISANYLELAAPTSSHETLEKCRAHLLYEPIKDFALQRLVRTDVWVKLPVEQTADKASLFGHFTYGITSMRSQVPEKISTSGKEIDLTTPLFSSLIDVMCLLPLGVGDFLKHPSCKGFDTSDVVSAIQILVATGVAQPMRGRYEGRSSAMTPYPAWANGFNAHFKKAEIHSPSIMLASPIVGSAVLLSVREALVLQALSRVGLANISGALFLTLTKLINDNPALAAQVIETTDLTDEAIHALVTNVLENGMVRWYAYGLLAA